MQVSKWGNSLAVRIPADVVELLSLQDGDEISSSRNFKVNKDRRREAALAEMNALNWKVPAGFHFNRNEAHER